MFDEMDEEEEEEGDELFDDEDEDELEGLPPFLQSKEERNLKKVARQVARPPLSFFSSLYPFLSISLSLDLPFFITPALPARVPQILSCLLCLAGDWALHNNAALRAEGTEGLAIRDCIFEDLGGNAEAAMGHRPRNVACITALGRD